MDCIDCGRCFATERGLKIHARHAHEPATGQGSQAWAKRNDIRTLSIIQMQILLRLHESSDHRAFLDGITGGSVNGLARLGWIAPAGSIQKRMRWELVRSLTDSEVGLLRQLTK